MSPSALRRITSKRKDVRRDVFSSRLVVASISAKTFASAAYGTLYDTINRDRCESEAMTYGSPAFQPFGRSTSWVRERIASALEDEDGSS